MRFGRTADEYEQKRSNEDNDIWIKGFRDGETTVRFLQPTGQWVTYLEHFSEGPGFFPCSEESDCPGCNDPVEKTQKRSLRYAVNCLGERGRVDVHKVGSRLFKSLKGREQRAETLLDRDYTIIRSGKGLETIYEFEPGERYPVPDLDTLALHDIGKVLEEKYSAAEKAYGIDPTAVPEPQADTGHELSVVDRLQRGITDPESVTPAELKEFLDARGIDYPARAPRSRLEALVTAYVTNNPFN